MAKFEEYPVLEEDTLAAYLVKEADGYYVTDLDGNKLSDAPCKVSERYNSYIIPANPSNRKWYNVDKAEKDINADGKIALLYKASKHIGPTSGKLPNAKLISYLPEDLQAEYKSIVDEAVALMQADKAKPVSKADKIRARMAKLQAELDMLNGVESEN